MRTITYVLTDPEIPVGWYVKVDDQRIEAGPFTSERDALDYMNARHVARKQLFDRGLPWANDAFDEGFAAGYRFATSGGPQG